MATMQDRNSIISHRYQKTRFLIPKSTGAFTTLPLLPASIRTSKSFHIYPSPLKLRIKQITPEITNIYSLPLSLDKPLFSIHYP